MFLINLGRIGKNILRACLNLDDYFEGYFNHWEISRFFMFWLMTSEMYKKCSIPPIISIGDIVQPWKVCDP